MSESQKKHPIDGFTIQKSQSHDLSEVPGIAELLGKKTRFKSKGIKESPEAPSLQTSKSTLKSLKDFGTKIEMHFELKNGFYRFIQSNILSSNRFMGLDDLLNKMIIPEKEVQNDFQEWNPEENQTWFMLLGMEGESWIQAVLSHEKKLLTLFVSAKPMKEKEKDIIEYCEANYSGLTHKSIELDIAS